MKLRDSSADEIVDTHMRLFATLSDEDVAAAVGRAESRMRAAGAHASVLRRPSVARTRAAQWGSAAAAAVLAAAIGAAILWPRGTQAYATGDTGTLFTLPDDSRVEMRAHSALTVDRADDGLRINLTQGGIIVDAADRRDGHLYVRTKDMTVAVVGTVFLVSAEEGGSRVAVIEGEVRVRDGARETTLGPGQHVSTNPAVPPRPVKDEIAWSRHANAHVALLQQSVPQTPAQTNPPPGLSERGESKVQFEEASIRPCADDDRQAPGGRGGGAGNSLLMTPGRLYVSCMSVPTLIRTAYGYSPLGLEILQASETPTSSRFGLRFGNTYSLGGVEPLDRVRGGPEWVRSDTYTIEAVAGPAANAETMQGPMLQELLARRFQLRVHVEAEQVEAYALTVAPGGFKIKPMEPGTCNSEGNTEEVRAERIRRGFRGPVLMSEAALLGIKPSCGGWYAGWNGPNMRSEHSQRGFAAVATILAGALDARVVDRTGMNDWVLFAWEWGPDENTPKILARMNDTERGPQRPGPRRPGFDGPLTLPKAPSIFVSLEQQLGLKVEPIRLPREFIVIDRVERPGPN